MASWRPIDKHDDDRHSHLDGIVAKPMKSSAKSQLPPRRCPFGPLPISTKTASYAIIALVICYCLAKISVTVRATNFYLSDTSFQKSGIRSVVNTNHSPDWCIETTRALDVSTWPPIVYHKDRHPNATENANYDEVKFSSVEEDDELARHTVEQFNKLRSSVLTPQMLNESFRLGKTYPASAFAKRIKELSQSTPISTTPIKPLQIAVFGTSFTIGSNCGESSGQISSECAWPDRLIQRWEEIFTFTNIPTTWRHYQQNAQGSNNIAQKLASIVNDFKSMNATPDAILLDNSITDATYHFSWFEALIRTLIQLFPSAVIVSIIDGVPLYVPGKDFDVTEVETLSRIQQHYGLTVVDMPRMVHRLHSESEIQRITGNFNHSIDLIWPQSAHMVFSNGTICKDVECEHAPANWANFLPTVRKTKVAYYPENHPPWPTHQYVADSVMYALLRVLQSGLGCDHDDSGDNNSPVIPETTVLPKEDIENKILGICLTPLSTIDAKAPHYTHNNISNASNPDNEVVVTCGDWKWTTDERKRSGWQSEEYGSIIRFRLKVSENPTISLTYMKSYENFGNLRVTFRTLRRQDLESPLLGCDAIDTFKNPTEMPSLELDGGLRKYSLSETTAFPSKIEPLDVVSANAWNLLNRTVLSHMSSDVEFVDVYVENPNEFGNRKRIKIQSVTSC